jgi:hypothetical protein
MRRMQIVTLALLAVGFAIYGWMNSYVTLSSDDPHAYAPFVLKALLGLGVSQAILIVLVLRGQGFVRHLALGAVLLNCFALFNSLIFASHVLFAR